MAVIVYLDGVDVIKGSRKGLTFDTSQASWIVKRKPSPTNPNTNSRNKVRSLLYTTNAYYWAMTAAQRTAWGNFAAATNVTGPYGMTGHQAGCAAFFKLELNAQLAGDPLYIVPPNPAPYPGAHFTNLVRIDNNTVRATFWPSPLLGTQQIYLRQGIPGAGVRRWSPEDGYIAQYSPQNPNSPYDFTTKFLHLAGWHGRYWLGTQNKKGKRTVETLFDI